VARVGNQHILVKQPHLQSPAALYLLRRKYASISYYLRWEKYRKEYLATQNLTCHYCKQTNLKIKSKDPKELATIDHVVPRALGGKNEPSNYVVACQHCNEKKGAKLANR
jgi:5-methylcytosine-specific restriction endonuclease McrA